MAEPALDIRQWLTAARAGSREALGQALDSCRNHLLRVAQRELDPELRAKGDASDLVQETFLEAQRDFAQFQGVSEAELRAWLSRLLFNNVCNFSRRYHETDKRAIEREVALRRDDSSEGVGGPQARAPSPSTQAMEHEVARALHQALARMPDDYRRVIELRYVEEHSFEEIGRLMSRSPDAARKLWARAIERLGEEWRGPG
jgi:RNA polymerase sigma-70 factor (ECF subfamily)